MSLCVQQCEWSCNATDGRQCERKNPALLLLTSGDAAVRLRAAGRMALRESMLWIVRAKEKQERGEEQSCGR